LKVLHLQKVAGIAGSENHLLTLLPRLRQYGYEPTMLVLADGEDRPGPFVERLRASGVEAGILPMRGSIDPMLVGRLVRHVRRHAPDLVHTHLFHADLYGSLAARLAGVRHIVATKHGFNPWRRRLHYALLDRMAAYSQRRIITISNAIGRWLVEVEGLPAGKMRTIHYALDAGQFRRQGEGGPVLSDPPGPVIGTVTRLMRQKGVHVLIQAFAHCVKEQPAASLVIAGDGPARSELEQQATALGIKAQVQFLGYVPHPRLGYLMEGFDIFAFPTFGEGFGLAVLEAMALGKPVVASDVMAIPEIVLQGKTGLLVPPDDAPALANALLKLLGDAALRDQFGNAGRQRAQAEFTVERMVGETVEVYEEARKG
jgi:glycosyltransferase involved in cell wall biosynthesis